MTDLWKERRQSPFEILGMTVWPRCDLATWLLNRGWHFPFFVSFPRQIAPVADCSRSQRQTCWSTRMSYVTNSLTWHVRSAQNTSEEVKVQVPYWYCCALHVATTVLQQPLLLFHWTALLAPRWLLFVLCSESCVVMEVMEVSEAAHNGRLAGGGRQHCILLTGRWCRLLLLRQLVICSWQIWKSVTKMSCFFWRALLKIKLLGN